MAAADRGRLDAAVELNLATFLGPAITAEARARVARMQRLTFEIQFAARDVTKARDSALVRNDDFDLSAGTARTVVVSGDHDVDYFRGTADHLAASIPGATLVTLPWAGHLPTVEDPMVMTPMLLEWLHG